MQTKLTLRLDNNIIERAKEFAYKQGTSLSKLVSKLLELHIISNTHSSLENNSDPEFEEAMQHPFMQKFVGALDNSESIDKDNYADYLEDKYK